MSGKNKFGFGDIGAVPVPSKRDRSVGPMGAAVREAAESLQETTEAKIEKRRLNAEDAKAWRLAQEEGRVLVRLPLDAIGTDALPRDRLDLDAVAASDEMEELKASIRARGQREPIEVFRDAAGVLQLKKGWRRLTALRQLYLETQADAFAEVVARIEPGAAPSEAVRLARYVDMVEENVVREDLSFAEMAQVAIAAAEDPDVEGTDPDVLVGQLYGALHKMKRSYIRSFVGLLTALGPSLQFPRAVSRNLGIDVARALKAQPEAVEPLRRALGACGSAEDQSGALMAFLREGQGGEARPKPVREKFEFHLGQTKVTARNGECRILSRDDFTSVPRSRLERAVRAFEAALREE